MSDQCPYHLAGKCEFERLGNGDMMCIRQPFCKTAFGGRTFSESVKDFHLQRELQTLIDENQKRIDSGDESVD